MDKYKLHQARQVKQLILHPAWYDYEQFIYSLIIDKISTNVSKDTLIGLKLAIDEAKKFITTYITTEEKNEK